MNARNLPVSAMAVLLILFLLMSAGCTSIPGPSPRSAPLATATPVPDEVVPMKTMRVTTAITVPPAMTSETISPGVITTTGPPLQGSYESRTCAQQGGWIVVPGQRCPGTWRITVDSFSCCPAAPVREQLQNTRVTIEPFDLLMVIDDDPGSILP
jgi:hypothetical protein